VARTRRILRWLAISAGGLVALLLVSLAGLYGAAQSERGRAWIARNLEAAVTEPGGLELRIGRLDGRLPHEIRLTGIELADPAGVWLTVDSLALDWRPLALFSRTLEISALQAGQVRIERLPETPDTADDAGAGGLPELPFRVVVERLVIGQVSLGEEVLGVAAAFGVQGEAATRDTDTLRAALTLERSDGVAGRVAAEARYRLKDRHLALDIEVVEPAGGLIARALEIPDLPALEAALHGAGSLDDWAGRLELSLRELASLTAEISLAGRDPLTFALVGQGTAERPVAELPWRLLDGPLDFRLEGAWHSAGTLRLDQARFETAAARLELTGSLDSAAEQVDVKARAELKDDTLLADVVGAVMARGLVLDLTAKGALLQPELSAEVALEALVMPELEAVGARATASFRPAAPLDRGPPRGKIEAAGNFQSLNIVALSDLGPLIGEAPAWRLEGDLDLERNRLDARTLGLAGAQLTVSGGGALSFDDGKADMDLEVAAADLSGLSSLIGFGIGGRARLAGPLTLENFGESLSAALTGELLELTVEEPVIAALLAGRSKIAAGLSVTPDGSLTVRDIALDTARGAHLTGALSMPADFETLTAEYRLELDDSAALSEVLALDLAGAVLVEGTAKGKIDDPHLAGRLTIPRARLEGFAFGALELDYSAADLAGEPRGHLAAAGESQLGKFDAETDYRLDATQFTLTALRATAQGLSVQGQASIPLDGAPVTAQLDGRSADLAPWIRLAGLEGGGAAEAKVTLFAEGARQAAAATAKATGLTLNLGGGQTLLLATLDAKAELRDLPAQSGGELTLAATGLRLDALELDRLTFAGKGALDDAALDLNAAGRFHGDLNIASSGRLTRKGDILALDLARLEGRVIDQEIRLRAPARIERQREITRIRGLALHLGEATLSADASLGGKDITLDLRTGALPVALFEPVLDVRGLSGRLTSRIEVRGTTRDPSGRLDLQVADLKVSTVKDVPPLQLDLDGTWRAGRLAMDGSLEGMAKRAARFNADLPLRLDPASLAPVLPQDEAIRGRVEWQGQIAEIWTLVPITGHNLDGKGEIDLRVSGTLGRPKSSGRLSLSQGQYESFEYGTLLHKLELELKLDGDRVTIAKLSGNDGDKGKLTGTGRLDLLPAKDFPMELQVKFDAFRMVRRDDVTASSDGTLSLKGSLARARLSGKFKTREVEIRIPDKLPPDVVDLGAIEVEKQGLPEPVRPEASEAAEAFDLRFDLLVDMPRRVFLRGRGLDSEWAGSLKLAGNLAKPILGGRLNLVRGQLSILGKVFKLSSGSVRFTDQGKIDPLVDVAAVNQADDLTVTARVSGPASNPALEISSVPELPQDEIISRVLFGKNTTQLTGIEAVQLGAAAAELSGAGGGAVGILDLARDKLGIDVLRVESSGTDDSATPALSAGKYVTEDVFVGVKQGATAESGEVGVEVELTPNISVESGVGQTGASKVGVKFKWDY